MLTGVFIGVVSHIVWDSFTHQGRPLVEVFSWLQLVLFNIDDYPVYGYRLLQHLSTLFGLAFLLYLFLRWFRAAPKVSESRDYAYWFKLFSFTLCVLVPVSTAAMKFIAGLKLLFVTNLVSTVITTGQTFLFDWFVTGIVFVVANKQVTRQI